MDSEDYLNLSGIQHFAFCKRQWALIHLEQQWKENALTAGGRYMHRHADNPTFSETRKNIIITRAVPLISHALQIYGVADIIEYHKSETGISITNRDGLYTIVPVEYKYGRRKKGCWDEVQLCAQAICLEEMFDTQIPFGYLYYGSTRKRVIIEFTAELRTLVSNLVSEMYEYYNRGQTPKGIYGHYCLNCSLYDICLPKISERQKNVADYIEKFSKVI